MSRTRRSTSDTNIRYVYIFSPFFSAPFSYIFVFNFTPISCRVRLTAIARCPFWHFSHSLHGKVLQYVPVNYDRMNTPRPKRRFNIYFNSRTLVKLSAGNNNICEWILDYPAIGSNYKTFSNWIRLLTPLYSAHVKL